MGGCLSKSHQPAVTVNSQRINNIPKFSNDLSVVEPLNEPIGNEAGTVRRQDTQILHGISFFLNNFKAVLLPFC